MTTMAVESDCTRLETGCLIGVMRHRAKENSILLGICEEPTHNKVKIKDIHDNTSKYYEWNNIRLIQYLLDNRSLSGFQNNVQLENNQDLYSLWYNEKDKSYTSVYYPCKYIKHNSERITIQFHDKRQSVEQIHFVNVYNYKIPVVIKASNCLNSHPFNAFITSLNKPQIHKDMIDDLSNMSVNKKRLWNKVTPETIVDSLNDDNVSLINKHPKPKEVFVRSANKYALVYSKEEGFKYNTITIEISNKWLFDNVLNGAYHIQNGKKVFRFYFKQPERESKGKLCTKIEESVAFSAQYYYMSYGITQGGVIDDNHRIFSKYYCLHKKWSDCPAVHVSELFINIRSQNSVIKLSSNDRIHVHWKDLPVGFIRKHQRENYGDKLATFEYPEIIKNYKDDIKVLHGNFSGKPQTQHQLRKIRSIKNQVVTPIKKNNNRKMTHLEVCNMHMPSLADKYKQLDVQNLDNIRGLNYNDLGYLFKWDGFVPALIMCHEAQLKIVRVKAEKGMVIINVDDTSNKMQLIDGNRINHTLGSTPVDGKKSMWVFLFLNGDWRACAFRVQFVHTWNRLTLNGSKNGNYSFIIDGYTGFFQVICSTCNLYEPYKYSRRCMLYVLGQVDEDYLPKVLIRRGKEHQYKNVKDKYKRSPSCRRFGKSMLRFQFSSTEGREWKEGISMMFYVGNDEWKSLNCNEIFIIDVLTQCKFDLDIYAFMLKENKIYDQQNNDTKDENDDSDDEKDINVDEQMKDLKSKNTTIIAPYKNSSKWLFVFDFDDSNLTIIHKRLNVTLPIIFRNNYQQWKCLLEDTNFVTYMFTIHLQFAGNNSPIIFNKFEEKVEHNNHAENANMQLSMLLKQWFTNSKPSLLRFIDISYNYVMSEVESFVQHNKLRVLAKNKKAMKAVTASHVAGFKTGSFKEPNEDEKQISFRLPALLSKIEAIIKPFKISPAILYTSFKSFAKVNDGIIFKCNQATAVSYINAMFKNRHWSYDPKQLQIVLDWIGEGNKLIDEYKIICNDGTIMNSKEKEMKLLLCKSSIEKFVKGEYKCVSELYDIHSGK
eukprot:452631_1